LQVLAGEDLHIFSTVAAGGAGAIAASAHLHTARFASVVRLLRDGKLEPARALWSGLPALIDALFAEPNPAPLGFAGAPGVAAQRTAPPHDGGQR
jgi:4-hydroxy-tetrahydrodipicolinate synthase